MKQLSNSQAAPSRIPTAQKAFTIMEVMLAMFVLALAIGSSIVALRMGFSMIETARDQTVASQFLQGEIETLRLKNWTELLLLPEEEEFVIESAFDSSVADRFHCVRRIEDARAGVNIKRVTLLTTWKTSNGVDRKLTYQTLIAKDGINDYYYRSSPRID